ncbi:MAG: DNA-directed RNA polymerase subunit alpha [Gemmatimonadetes bacterium]|nr:DNA-directed RNA polymerase subunit alpha [Gemmatimonadota bacterium]
MKMKMKSLTMPKRVEVEKETTTDRYGKFVVQPLERGFGHTLGNAMRRVLLSSIHGAAVTAVRIEGVQHEFSTLPGVLEDMSQIVLALKRLRVKLLADIEPKTIRISHSGKGPVTAADIEPDPEIVILNHDLHIATATEDRKFQLEAEITTGRGYVPVDRSALDGSGIGTIPVDAVYSPVTRVLYEVGNTRVGQRTDYDKLTLEVHTDGTVSPEDAVSFAGKILKDHLQLFITFEEEPEIEEEEEHDEELERMKDLLRRPVDELELSVRSANCLRMANIRTLGDLVQKTEPQMLKYRNFGRKSLVELKEILSEYGLGFAMEVEGFIPPQGAPAADTEVDESTEATIAG